MQNLQKSWQNPTEMQKERENLSKTCKTTQNRLKLMTVRLSPLQRVAKLPKINANLLQRNATPPERVVTPTNIDAKHQI